MATDKGVVCGMGEVWSFFGALRNGGSSEDLIFYLECRVIQRLNNGCMLSVLVKPLRQADDGRWLMAELCCRVLVLPVPRAHLEAAWKWVKKTLLLLPCLAGRSEPYGKEL